MKVAVHDKATGARIVLLENAKSYKYCECCGDVEHYMYICDSLVLCRDCAKSWKRLGLEKFLETYWLPFDMPLMKWRCENSKNADSISSKS